MNLLRNSQTNPRLSVYAQLFGVFYFDATPMALPVTKLIPHDKPNQCATWSKHGVAGWYIGPAVENYICYKIFVNDTRSEQISDIVDFSHRVWKCPEYLLKTPIY